MTQTAPTGSRRLIAWNGLQFCLPPSWEVIVASPRHLLVERDFRPVLEIRWDGSGKGSPADIVESTIQRFTKSGQAARETHVPRPFAAIPGCSGAVGLCWHECERLDGLVWQCPGCRTVLFCHLYHQRQTEEAAVCALLQTLRCCRESGAPSLWSVQDFRLSLPAGFHFRDYTLAAGLSRLAFQGHGLELQFCRLAPASARLADRSLPQLLGQLLGRVQPVEVLTDTPGVHECRNRPRTLPRLWQRLFRRLQFRWGRIWHDAQHDRLLTLTAAGARPIDLDTVHRLCANYEILSLPSLQ